MCRSQDTDVQGSGYLLPDWLVLELRTVRSPDSGVSGVCVCVCVCALHTHVHTCLFLLREAQAMCTPQSQGQPLPDNLLSKHTFTHFQAFSPLLCFSLFRFGLCSRGIRGEREEPGNRNWKSFGMNFSLEFHSTRTTHCLHPAPSASAVLLFEPRVNPAPGIQEALHKCLLSLGNGKNETAVYRGGSE